jgi:type I restriction enzyme, S subunit
MAGRYHAYESYKPSEMSWVENIPSHWGRSKIGFESIVKARLGWKGLKADEYVKDGYVFLATPNIKDAEIDFENVNYITEDRYLESPEIMLQQGDVLVTKDGSTTGTTNVVRQLPRPATVNSSIAVLRPKKSMDSLYFYYFFTSEYTQNVIKMMRGGMGVPHLFQADLRWFDLILPPIAEQKAIANFLDHETAKIDTLIEKQQLLIKLLKEKRQTVISHAVTKGLNPDAPLRDSGVEWLGEVPEHWELPKLIHRTTNIGDGLHSTPQYKDRTGYYFVNGNNLVDGNIVIGSTAKEVPEEEYKKHYIRLDSNSVLLSINGTIGNVARYNGEQVILGKSAAYMNCANGLLPEYLMFYLQSSQLLRYYDLEVTGTTIFNLSLNSIRQMKVCVPLKHEQKEIELYCVQQKKEYGVLIYKAHSAIELMQERRTALVSAAVTGKIDVRNWQPPPPNQTNKEDSHD